MRAPEPATIAVPFALAVIAAAFLYALPAIAGGDSQKTREELDRLNQRIEGEEERAKTLEGQAGAAETEVQDLQARLIALAAAAQSREGEIAALTPDIAALEAKRVDAQAALNARMDALMQSIGALERIERRPPAALLAQPGEAIDRARSAELLAGLVPHLQADANELKSRLSEIDEIEGALIERRTRLETARGELLNDRRAIDLTVQRRARDAKSLARELEGERKRIAMLAAKAKDLGTLLATLEANEKSRRAEWEAESAAPGVTAAMLAAIADRLPARGKIVVAFKQADSAGIPSSGVTIAASPGAQVTTPSKGHVAFAGPFKGYGQLLIVAAPGGYHVLLAGLSRLYADLGQDLKSGEPVGELSEGPGPARLYIEIRRNGKPIDPLPWLAARNGKVSG